jgi:hypothetical protein
VTGPTKPPRKRAPRKAAAASQPRTVASDAEAVVAVPVVSGVAEAAEHQRDMWEQAFRPESPELLARLSGHPPLVHELWSRVMESVRSVAKGDYNEDQNFSFRGVDSVVDKVGPALREHGVHIRPRRILEHTATEYTSKRGSRMVNRIMRVEWEVTGPCGDSFVGESMGEAADTGDKSMTKAQSVAYRVFLLQALCIPTGEPDPDASAHERDTPAAQEGYYFDRQQERQQYRRDEQRQAQAGEENQDPTDPNASPEAIEAARKQLWRTAKGLGWEWSALAARFKSDNDGKEMKQTDVVTIEGFMATIMREAEEEEDRAKAAAADVLGAKEVAPDEAQNNEPLL